MNRKPQYLRTRLHSAPMRWVTAVLALIGLVTASGLGGVRYFFCLPMGTTQLACCCADEDADMSREPAARVPCCETRHYDEAAQAGDPSARRLLDPSPALPIAFNPPPPVLDTPASLRMALAPTAQARAGPTRPLQSYLRTWLC